MIVYKSAILISSIAFLFFGANCLLAKALKIEFKRYGLTEGQRKLTGILQITGALGLGVGYFYAIDTLLLAAAFGLCLLMLLGFGVRLKIKDSLIQSLPSLIFAIINGYIGFVTFQNIMA